MAAKCSLHPGLASAGEVCDLPYCKNCMDGIAAARKAVPTHVEPKECFIVYQGKAGWAALEGTGCAHWLNHKLGKRKGVGAAGCCLAGYACRVRDTISSLKTVASLRAGTVVKGDIAKVRKGGIFAKLDDSHCGIVVQVKPPAAGAALPSIAIQNDSSKQGGVKTNDFADYFDSTGKFLA